jgi:choline monooxygenase
MPRPHITPDLSDYDPNAPLNRAQTLPARWYTEPAFYATEQQKIFGATWQLVARIDQVSAPGDYLTFELGGEPLVLIRQANGQLAVLSNVCRHRASLLLQGSGKALKSMLCPYHGWNYDLQGKLSGAREFQEALDWKKENVCLPRFSVDTFGPYVFAHLGPNPPALSETLGNIPREIAESNHDLGRFTFTERRDYVIECNWKVYVENYQEGYHLPIVHPALFREVDYDRYRIDNYPTYSYHDAPLRKYSESDPRTQNRRYGQAGVELRTLYYWIYPNLMFNIYPDNLSMNLIVPLGPEKTLTRFEWFYTPEYLEKGPGWLQDNLAFGEQVQQEDIRICELVQRGLRSQTYHSGRLSPKRENGVHHFHKLVHASLSR